jgi:hypothetical protein
MGARGTAYQGLICAIRMSSRYLINPVIPTGIGLAAEAARKQRTERKAFVVKNAPGSVPLCGGICVLQGRLLLPSPLS